MRIGSRRMHRVGHAARVAISLGLTTLTLSHPSVAGEAVCEDAKRVLKAYEADGGGSLKRAMLSQTKSSTRWSAALDVSGFSGCRLIQSQGKQAPSYFCEQAGSSVQQVKSKADQLAESLTRCFKTPPSKDSDAAGVHYIFEIPSDRYLEGVALSVSGSRIELTGGFSVHLRIAPPR